MQKVELFVASAELLSKLRDDYLKGEEVAGGHQVGLLLNDAVCHAHLQKARGRSPPANTSAASAPDERQCTHGAIFARAYVSSGRLVRPCTKGQNGCWHMVVEYLRYALSGDSDGSPLALPLPSALLLRDWPTRIPQGVLGFVAGACRSTGVSEGPCTALRRSPWLEHAPCVTLPSSPRLSHFWEGPS